MKTLSYLLSQGAAKDIRSYVQMKGTRYAAQNGSNLESRADIYGQNCIGPSCEALAEILRLAAYGGIGHNNLDPGCVLSQFNQSHLAAFLFKY